MPCHAGALVRACFSPPSPEAVRRAVEDVYRDGGLQRSLPGPVPAASPRSTGAGGWSVLAEALTWTAAGVAVVLLVAWLVREASARGRRAALPSAPSPPSPGAPLLAAPLEAAEALAAKGLWAEAIHALLLRTLETLVVATRTVLPAALTSREIHGLVPLADHARSALGDLVLAVEVSRFGGARAGPDDYARCLARFHDFAAAYGRPA